MDVFFDGNWIKLVQKSAKKEISSLVHFFWQQRKNVAQKNMWAKSMFWQKNFREFAEISLVLGQISKNS
jgi:hypothetical protein